MSRAEFERWVAFYNLHPFDDYHRFARPAALIASSAHGADIRELLDWLQHKAPAPGLSEADMNTLKAFGLKPPTTPRRKKT